MDNGAALMQMSLLYGSLVVTLLLVRIFWG